jgi:hypothetical protein
VSDKKTQYIDASYKPFKVNWSAPGSNDGSLISLEPGADGEFLLLDEGSEHPWKTFAGARITGLRQMSALPAEGLRVSLCQATSGTDPLATSRIDPRLLINRFGLRGSRWPG